LRARGSSTAITDLPPVTATTPSHAGSIAARVGAVVRLAIAALVLGWSAYGAAQPAAVSERSVKAAFLYKFASYVEWPDSATAGDSPIVIAVLGDNDFAQELAEITAGRTVNDRPIVIRRLDDDEPMDASGLQVLFISDEERGELPRVLAAAGDKPILTVTESAGAIADGAIINFTVDAERVRFEVSLPAAETSRLRLNARLLGVAQRVHREPQ
jgi:hypothetical protein